MTGWLIRVLPLIIHGPLRSPADYDEGVYFASAALVGRGHTLYRDFAFMHPPGITYVLAPLTFLGSPSTAFGLTRIAMTFVGAVNVYLVGRLAARYVRPPAAVAAAAAYALHPTIVILERGVYLEPILNLLCLLAALTWLRCDEEAEGRKGRRALSTGLLLGAAITVKLWGAFALIACLATLPRARWKRDGTRLIGGVLVAAGLLLAPGFVRAPSAFVDDVIIFQIDRAPDGVASLSERLGSIILGSTDGSPMPLTRALTAVAASIVLIGAVRLAGTSRLTRFAVVWFLAILGGFLVSSTYFEQYNGAFAPAVALLVGGSMDLLIGLLEPGVATARRCAGVVGAASLGIAFLIASTAVLHRSRFYMDETRDIGTAVRAYKGDCVFSFEPLWLVAGDRLPDPDRVGRTAVDPYGAQLEAVVEAGQAYGSVNEAIRDVASAALIKRAVDGCDAVVLGPRGQYQLGDLLPMFLTTHRLVAELSPNGPTLWVRD